MVSSFVFILPGILWSLYMLRQVFIYRKLKEEARYKSNFNDLRKRLLKRYILNLTFSWLILLIVTTLIWALYSSTGK